MTSKIAMPNLATITEGLEQGIWELRAAPTRYCSGPDTAQDCFGVRTVRGSLVKIIFYMRINLFLLEMRPMMNQILIESLRLGSSQFFLAPQIHVKTLVFASKSTKSRFLFASRISFIGS